MSDKKYCIQLAECDGDSKDVYSYDEVEIGTWVDGKPIYRKVITGKLADKSGDALVFANVSDLGIDELINLHGKLSDKNSLNQIAFPVSFNQVGGVYYAVNMYYGVETGNIFYHLLNSYGAYSGSTAYAILEYTKK
ncbi:hypothetical protein [Lacrimispora sp.]|uniref:hypothetical protein n=1 Tax=Lacrimispora sp. TaxID=2719234 RepID=UPI0028A9353D|nr:hypothetical protein [Lacrimispora sp.]